ncbi:MAG TPA: IS5 family transposase [Thermoanaerobaculia bacterium]|nr:IS5 family transposase [Thermoanaerobaculia bacterium]
MASKGSRSSSKGRRGRPRKLTSAQVEVLVGLVRENPLLSLDDLVWSFREQTGVTVSTPTVRKYLQEAGFERSRPPKGATAEAAGASDATGDAEPPPKVYGYGQAHRDPGDGARYPCGLTDSEWEHIREIFDPPGRTGRPPKYPRRQVLDACIYVLRSGCSWRMLPKDFPPWQVVYRTFRRWLARGLFEQMYDALRKLWRSRQRRAPDPTATILDSQSVKTSPQGGPKGYDAGKKVKGRKRHLVTDTLGLLIAVLVTAASTQDRDAAMPVMELAKHKVPGIQKLYVDSGYAGQRARELRTQHQLDVEVVRHPANRNVGRWHEGQLPLWKEIPTGFVVLPKRWIIERTNAWNDRPRRMNKDHDRSLAVSTAWIWLAEGRRLLRRLTTEAPKTAD